MDVSLQNLTKSFGDVGAVNDLNLDIKDREFVAFLGPSGCGKTTTLLMVAGIYKPSGGTIRFGERLVNQIPPRDRNIGMVFQSYALYPHMTVFQNIAYPLKLKNVPRLQQDVEVKRIAQVMGIGDLLRRPGQLSGGQQQRVALGRALVKESDILLFDEPLSNLDARLRLTMRGEIKHLQKRLGITSIFVTHDQTEAMTMADRIAVMNKGKLEAFDTPDDLYNCPKSLFVAGFIGNPPMNIIDVEIHLVDGCYTARHEHLSLVIPTERGQLAAQAKTAKLGIRAEDIMLATEADNENTISGEVFIVEPLGRDDMLDVVVGDTHFYALAEPEKRIRPGHQVRLHFNTARAQFFDPQTEKSLLRH